MNAERLLALYEKVADGADAVPRLRRFVLDLAVRGKLVPQEAGDEPASELLKRIAAARADAPKSARNGNKKRVDPSLTELPFDLPDGWSRTQLSDLVRVVNGRAYKKPELLEEGTPVLRVGNLFTSDHWYYSNLQLEDDKYCEKGDLIYAWSASFGPFIWDGPRVIYHYHIWKLPLFSEVDLDKQFLYLFLQQKTREIKDAGHGISMVHMTKEKMEQLAVPLPPLAEQRRIVGSVEELMALLDRLEAARTAREATRDRLTAASLTRLTTPDADAADFPANARFALATLPALTTRPDQIKPLRQTILNLAVRGKLVDQDPTDEALPKVDKGLPSDTAAAFDIPKGWQWSRLRALGTLKGGGTPSKARDDFWNGHIPWVSPKDMKVDYIDAAQLSITDAAVAGSAVNLIGPESVLFVVRGMILAHSFPVAIAKVPVTINQDMKAIILKKPEMAEYILRALKGLTPEMLARVQRSSHGTCRIEGSDYGDFLIPLPPLAEQHRIVVRVDALMALCDRLEAALTTADTTRARLLEALLHEALDPAVNAITEAAE
ncbi:MAG: restriction endonuclease subunit S [Roseovarius sp.]